VQLKYLGTRITNQSFIQEEIMSRLNSEYPKTVKIRIYKPIILPVVVFECETWSLTLREEDKLRGFEKRVLRKMLGEMREEERGSCGENCITRSFMICILRQI
jgi:hypothetical protein